MVVTRSQARLAENESPVEKSPQKAQYAAELAVERAARENWRPKQRRHRTPECLYSKGSGLQGLSFT